MAETWWGRRDFWCGLWLERGLVLGKLYILSTDSALWWDPNRGGAGSGGGRFPNPHRLPNPYFP